MAALLWVYNEACDVGDLIIGTPISRRGACDTEQLIGCLTDLLPLRQTVRPDMSFRELVVSTKAAVLEALTHRAVPYAEIMTAVSRKAWGVARLCQTVLVVDDAPRVPLTLPNVVADKVYVHTGKSKFDICLTLVIDDVGCYHGFLEYSTELYKERSAEQVARNFLLLLTATALEPERPLAQVALDELAAMTRSPEATQHPHHNEDRRIAP